MQVSSLLVTFPESSQACLRKPRDSFCTQKGPATGLSRVVHIGANESPLGRAHQVRRGQVCTRTWATGTVDSPYLGNWNSWLPVFGQLEQLTPRLFARFQQKAPACGRFLVRFCAVFKREKS